MVGSGLCILSKYPIAMTLFHSWSVNGYVHRIQHGKIDFDFDIFDDLEFRIYFTVSRISTGDWFGGKGVGLCQIMVQKQLVNIYIAHVRFMQLDECY